MFNLDLSTVQRTVTAAIGSVLVSFAFIGAAVGPARAEETASVSSTHQVAGSGQLLAS